ncbi:helix-turn-helix domain-containing protein [Rhodoglobus aureus]|uniref:Helix-turn-helix domain-containing protein n=1 Tax=Rhodoglobus aureus TaxID=191497 RepID=A0ABN1VM74_9MICO
MTTVIPSTVPKNDLQKLEKLATSFPDGALRVALDTIHNDLARGETVFVLADDEAVTPSRAAQILGLSRTHLYKVLDSGALEWHPVGARDRRILVKDLLAYRELMRGARRRTATVFAGGTAADDEALDEMI